MHRFPSPRGLAAASANISSSTHQCVTRRYVGRWRPAAVHAARLSMCFIANCPDLHARVTEIANEPDPKSHCELDTGIRPPAHRSQRTTSHCPLDACIACELLKNGVTRYEWI